MSVEIGWDAQSYFCSRTFVGQYRGTLVQLEQGITHGHAPILPYSISLLKRL